MRKLTVLWKGRGPSVNLPNPTISASGVFDKSTASALTAVNCISDGTCARCLLRPSLRHRQPLKDRSILPSELPS